MADRDKGENIARGPGESSLTHNLEFWMTLFPASLKNIPIIHLAIPGTYKLSFLLRNKILCVCQSCSLQKVVYDTVKCRLSLIVIST